METFPVWNHCGLEVESGPGWKYFVFGGTSKEFDETKLRERAESTNKMVYCDMEDEDLQEVKLNDSTLLPEPREDATMIYYQHSKNLLLFGGWNNEWFGDIYGICVSAIVGPSYSVKSIKPNMGRISGNQEITLYGNKLSNGNITVIFHSAYINNVFWPKKQITGVTAIKPLITNPNDIYTLSIDTTGATVIEGKDGWTVTQANTATNE